ncbi:uncharacterized protein LOC100198489 isoform X1 [Hydra vulgaris]|uniref:uncharacterized protein LOC100198489 isoform X1 n=1 Tax=Hydra vulgaris TaxID=6087 RepID=UPI0001925AC0|nr:clp protease adapter protein ClpF, chloroplastic [Hydra vulgaris]
MLRPGLQLVILFLAVPTQYLISKWMTPQQEYERQYLTSRFLRDSINLFKKLTNVSEWNSIISQLHYKLFYLENGECPAKEVMLYNEPNGYFAESPEPRTDRANVKYRIGQVIIHKKSGFKGVISGWDYKTKAPDLWIQANNLDKFLLNQPSYSILVDTKSRVNFKIAYVVEDHLEVVLNHEVDHPDIIDYFELFDGSQYLARPWLKELYPLD